MSRYIFLWIGILWFGTISVVGAEVIRVSATQGDATPRIQAAIEKARQYRGKPVVIRLEQGNYHLFRTSCSKQVYYISNTASEEENPDPTKHIGLWIRGIRNLTIEGDGARLVTHGEMTSFVIDSSENIILRNFTLTAADPSVPEMTVVDAGENYLTARIHPDSPYEIREGKFTWLGEGWNFTGGIAQVFEPWRNVTWRCNSPMSDVVKAIELEKGLVRFNYNKRPEGRVGQVFQMRDAIRDEVCGLILKSKQVTLEDLNIHFLGNFGIVGQYSENLTYNRLNCTPEWGHGRTCAGFADFVQMGDAGVDVGEHVELAQFRFAAEVAPAEAAANGFGPKLLHEIFKIRRVVQCFYPDDVFARLAFFEGVGAEAATCQRPALLCHLVEPAFFFFKFPDPEPFVQGFRLAHAYSSCKMLRPLVTSSSSRDNSRLSTSNPEGVS